MVTTSWARLDLRHLEAVVAVAEEGTFSAAAERLGYTQSAVSQQIATLERTVGATLFIRPGGPRPVRTTPAGDALVLHVRAVLARLRAARADLQALAAGERGSLSIGTLQSVGTKVVPRVLRRFREEWPAVVLNLHESHVLTDLVQGVEAGELDLSFTQLPLPEGPFAYRRILDDPFVFVVPSDSPQASQPLVSIDEIATLPLIGNRDKDAQSHISDRLRPAAQPARFVFRSNDNPTVQGLIGAGLAYGFLPLLAVDETDPHVAVLPVQPSVLPRRLAVVWHRDRVLDPVVTRFVETAAQVCADVAEEWALTFAQRRRARPSKSSGRRELPARGKSASRVKP